jgi:hypothetical protein
MNRHQRRRQNAMARQDQFFNDHVRHLPEVGLDVIGKPGVHHLVCFHDQWCRIYSGEACNCEPHVKVYAEPVRN